MKTLFIYAIASHNSKIIKRKEVLQILNQAQQHGFGAVSIIKKTQFAAKEKELGNLFEVKPYPKRSTAKAIKNADACVIIGDGQTITRKKQIMYKLMEEANKTGKLVMVLNMCV